MANDLSVLMPKIISRGMVTLRELVGFARAVNGDWGTEVASQGDTIDVPIPTGIGTRAVTPSNTKPAGVDRPAAKAQIQLNNWRQNDPIFLTDQEMAAINTRKNFLPMNMQEALRSLARDVNGSLHTEYKGVYGYVGAAGTTPFSTAVDEAVNARAQLFKQLCPPDFRRAIVDFNCEAKMLSLDAFKDASKTMSSDVVIKGEIGEKYGINWLADDGVLTHVSTPLTAGAATANGVQAVNAGSTDGGRTGTLSIAKLTNTSPLVKGDIISVAGSTQTYTVLADTTLIVGNTSVPIAPALKVATAGGEAITLKATHVVNLVFHRDAFALANRPLVMSSADFELGSRIMSITDPKTGLSLRLEVSRQHKQVMWEFDILWGAKLVRPELCTRLAG